MSGSAFLCIALVLITVVTSLPTVPNDVAPVVMVDSNSGSFEVQDISGWRNFFRMQNASESKDISNMELFSSSQLTAVPSAQVEDVIRYTIGKRISNDRLVAHGADSKRWTVPQDVTLALKYPTTGQGAIVTYAEIIVNQSSNTGRAQVIAGGIGQRYITTVVEAKNTLWFSYTANIYGI